MKPTSLLYRSAVRFRRLENDIALKLGFRDTDLITDRSLEYGFVSKELDLAPGAGKILDVGCAISPLPFVWAGLGHQVYGLDQRLLPTIEGYPTLSFFAQDIRRTSFPDKFFDRVVAVSTIEHVGLSGRFESQEDRDGDFHAIREMTRILKDDGFILLTVPYGKDMVERPMHRIYGEDRLPEMLQGLRRVKTEYVKRVKSNWMPATQAEVEGSVGYFAIVMLKLAKA